MANKNKTIIVTGASKGIGKAIAEDFAKLGCDLALISRCYEEVDSVAKKIVGGGSYCGYECDITDQERVVETFVEINKAFGSIDVLVNNAGINSRVTPATSTFGNLVSGWKDELLVNLTGSYICSLVAADYMCVGGGCIINISSIKGEEPTSSPGYGASKAGVIKLTKDLAKIFAPKGIRVNCVSPGFIDTGMTTELSDDKKSKYQSMIPAGRFGSVNEIAKVVSFLASDSASYIVGANLKVNGGYLM